MDRLQKYENGRHVINSVLHHDAFDMPPVGRQKTFKLSEKPGSPHEIFDHANEGPDAGLIGEVVSFRNFL